MQINSMETKKSRFFTIIYKGLELDFELFTYDYICSELKKQSHCFDSILETTIPDNKIGKHMKKFNIEEGRKKYHFFSYIKFFVDDDGEIYGIVGGKTNYLRPDFSFEEPKEGDNRVSRNFLYNRGLQWSRKIIILNHAPDLKKDDDDRQAKFIETFLQRKFNLFDS